MSWAFSQVEEDAFFSSVNILEAKDVLGCLPNHGYVCQLMSVFEDLDIQI